MSDPTKTPALDAFPIELGKTTKHLAFPIESLFAADDAVKEITGNGIFDGYDPAKLSTRQRLETTAVFLWAGLLAENRDAREKDAAEPELTLMQVRRLVSLRNLGALDKQVQAALKAWMPESKPDPTEPATEPASGSTPSIQ